MSAAPKFTQAMLRELRSIYRTGCPDDGYDSQAPAGLYFNAREKVLTALLKRELINGDEGDFKVTEAGRAILAKVDA
jgi:hypothetical protein